VTAYFVAGGAGFIGSHLVEALLEEPEASVTVYDNLSSGDRARLARALRDGRARLVEGDLKDLDALTAAVEGSEVVFHFAANPDIARAAREPAVDFWEGTYLHQNLLEACRVTGASRFLYASGSGVYGDLGERVVTEDAGGIHPVSTYGASKLGCEALLSAYAHMFGVHGVAFRFANVVGDRQTHGVTYDFVRKLRRDPSRLEILGDGRQSKAYIHVDDVVEAILLLARRGWSGFEVYNVSTEDYVTVSQIADMTVEALGLEDVEYAFTGGSRGWLGDVPVVRFDSSRIRALGWRPTRSSVEALRASIAANVQEAAAQAL
jgi:UDP-glucose 4-epimerase